MWPKCKSDSDFPFKWAPRGICTRPPLWPCGPFFHPLREEERNEGRRRSRWRNEELSVPHLWLKYYLAAFGRNLCTRSRPVFFHRAQAVICRPPRILGFLGEKSGMINQQSHLQTAPSERRGAGREALNACFFLPVPAHSWCSKEGLAALKLFRTPASHPHHPSRSISSLHHTWLHLTNAPIGSISSGVVEAV